MTGRKIGEIWETHDYQAFKIMKGNRDVTAKRAKKIRDSITKNGWIMNPINVNENFEVIDGQGRLEALRTLGLPVQYFVNVGAGDAECIALNASNTGWTMNDYIKLYAENGNDDYARFKALMDEYGVYGLNTISFAIGGTVMLNNIVVKQGKLKCTVEQYLSGRDRLSQLAQFSDILKISIGKRAFLAAAILFAIGC